MYERTYGNKYNRELSTVQIAALIRQDVKHAIKAGELPHGLKTSIRAKYFSMGSSIDVTITACPIEFLNPVRIQHDVEKPNEYAPEYHMPRYTEAGKELLAKLNAMMSAYNHDGSEIQVDYFDVKFYGHVTFDWQMEERERKSILVKTLCEKAGWPDWACEGYASEVRQ